MMHIRRILTLVVAVATLVGAPVLVAQQNNQKPKPRERPKLTREEQRDLQALSQMVDAVAAGKQPAPTDISLRWEGHHSVRASDGLTLVPFTLAIDGTKPAAPGTALYVRVVNKTAASAPAAENRGGNQRAVYPSDEVHFVDVSPDGKVSRDVALKPGDYEMFIAIKEKSLKDPPRNQPPAKAGLLRRDLTVPDFSGPDLLISTPIFAMSVEPLATPLTEDEQRANPYTFGGRLRVVPSHDAKLKNTGELQMLFWVYGTQHTAGKPDVQIEYNFHQKSADGEKFFNKAQPQVLNASTLPPNFDLTAGHQIMAFLGVPLASFPAGEYRLEVKLTDKLSGKTLTHNANFTVEA